MTASRPRRAGGRTQLEIVPDQLVWALYERESLDPKGTAVQVANQLADLRPFALGIGGRIGREYPENNVSVFKRVIPEGAGPVKPRFWGGDLCFWFLRQVLGTPI
jgi:hypothetical protein